jgi:hypothetical protein
MYRGCIEGVGLMNKECDYHPDLVKTLTTIQIVSAQTSNDIIWIKRGIYGILVVAMAVFTCFYNLDKRTTACERQIATQLSLGDMPRWIDTPSLKSHK